MAFLFCLGGGGGGGGGFTDPVTDQKQGGGGGGSSGHTTLMVSIDLLPDRLYIQVGGGGVGGAASSNGGAGILSYIAISPSNVVQNVVLISGNAVAGAGTGGGASTVGAGGAASTVASVSSMPFSGLGVLGLIAGQAGKSAISSTDGADMTFPTTGCLTMGGASGGGLPVNAVAPTAGGGCAAIATSYLSQQAPPPLTAGVSVVGSGSPQQWNPFWSFGGGGGGSQDAVAGFRGGNGALGAGGGGGGGGGATGGVGGSGGPGLVFIACWG